MTTDEDTPLLDDIIADLEARESMWTTEGEARRSASNSATRRARLDGRRFGLRGSVASTEVLRCT